MEPAATTAATTTSATTIVTSRGFRVAEFPLFLFRDGNGGLLLFLKRIDVSDVRNVPKAEAFYQALIRYKNDGVKTIELSLGNRTLTIFIQRWRLNFHATHYDREAEE